jgi:hypothetical protein
MDSSKFKIILIVALAAIGALYLGIAAATAQFTAIAWVVGVLGLVFVLALGKNVWILIPITLPLVGTINAIPGSPYAWWGAMAVVFAIYVLRFAMRKTDNLQLRWNALDFAVLLQFAALAQAFLRNPTGLSIMGGDTAGGKPYIIYGFAMVAYAMLSLTNTTLKTLGWIVISMVLISIADSSLSIVSQLIPAVAFMVLPIYSGVDFTAAQTGGVVETSEARLTGARSLGENLGKASLTLFRPIDSLNPLKFLPFAMTGIALIATLVSGYRSVFGLLLIYFVVGSIVRRRFVDVVIAGMFGFVGLVLLIGTGMTDKLPFGAQRILSVVPFIAVDDKARYDAENSSDFRFEMWKLALTTDRYIKNKWLGDGFNYSADEMRAAADSAFGDRRRSAGMGVQDIHLARGSYHGFHVQTIRFTGVFGLICALVGMGIWFRYAGIQIKHFRGRPEWGYVIYIAMPFLIYPFYYMLVFGDYQHGFAPLIVGSGLLKMLDNIRVRELATARAAAPLPATTPAPRPAPGTRRPLTPVRTNGLARP